jgi:hypothetical protein
MRLSSVAVAVVESLTLLACGGSEPDRELVRATQSRIAYGAADSVHTAVVAVLSPVGSNSVQECSGSIVKVANGNGYVLTAAHCCNTYAPTVVVVSNDYSVGEQYVFAPPPLPPAYPVVSGSAYYDSLFNATDHDFCMLKFSGASAAMGVLAVPSSSADGLQLGVPIEHIGFGVTEDSGSNTQRRTGSDTLDVALTSTLIEFSQGGTGLIPGTCAGDSGGPTLLPAGAPQAQQVVVAVQSFGNNSTCSQETLGGASRVSSEIGPGLFITSYLADMPIGTPAGRATAAPVGGPTVSATLAAGLLAVGLLALRRARFAAKFAG